MPPKKRAAVASVELQAGTSLPESLVKVIEGLSLGSTDKDSDIPYYISTQCAMLDYIIGRPGIPAGKLTTLYGKEGSAKSTLVYHLLTETQRIGGIAILSDSERRLSNDRASRIGLDLSQLIKVTAMTLEQTFADIEKVVQAIRATDQDIPVTVAVDSLAGLPSAAALEGDMTKSMPAKVARFVSFVFPRLVPWFARNNVTLIIVNQTRTHMDMSNGLRTPERRKVMGATQAMIAENSLVFWSSLMVRLHATGILGDRDNPEGIEVRSLITKNSVGPEGKHCEFNVLPLTGIDRLSSKLDLLEHLGVFDQTSGWYSYEPLDKKFRASEFAEVLAARPELEDLIHSAPELWVTGKGV